MFGIRKTFFTILAICFLIGMGSVFAVNDNGDNPIICVPRTQDTIRVDTVWANPDQQYVEVPVYFCADSAEQITGFEFNIGIPNGLEYADSFVVDAWSGGTILVYDSLTHVEVQGWDTTLTANQDTTFTLISIFFNVLDTVGFNQHIDLELVDDVYFYIADSSQAYDPAEDDGWVKTSLDTVYVMVDSVFGYSFQAWESQGMPKDTMYAKVPVMFYTGFDVDNYIFHLNLYPTSDTGSYPYQYAGYETAPGNPYEVEATQYATFTLRVRKHPDSTLFIPRETEDTLLTLLFRIKDFSSQYNEDVNFDTTISIPPNTGLAKYFKCYNSNETVDLVIGSNLHGGEIELPVYSADIDLPDTTYFNAYDTAYVPVLFNGTFYADYYYVIWRYSHGYLNLVDVLPGDLPAPQNVELEIIDTTDNYTYASIYPTYWDDNNFIPPGVEDTVCYLVVTKGPSFFPDYNFPISCADNLGFYGVVLDYFTPLDDTYNQIYRTNLNGLTVGWGSVRDPGASVPIENNEEYIDLYGPVGVADPDAMPYSYSLQQNYPNPFNAHTNIQFSIANEGQVVIDIYDMLGRKVKSLVSDYLVPGQYNVIWDGRNNSGMTVSSGFYFYLLTAEDYQESRKMMLIK